MKEKRAFVGGPLASEPAQDSCISLFEPKGSCKKISLKNQCNRNNFELTVHFVITSITRFPNVRIGFYVYLSKMRKKQCNFYTLQDMSGFVF